MSERLVLDVHILGFGPLAYAVAVLPMLRTVLRDVNTEKNFPASGILALLFAQLLTPP
jgi:hypothetical protein